MIARVLFLASPLLLLAALPSHASAQSNSGQNCTHQQSEGRSTTRSVLGGLGRIGLGRVGGVAAAMIPMTDMLSDALINLLDCREQQKASTATEEAVRGGDVGSTSTWTSETRPGVTGSSTVTAVEGDCMTVTDVVIVDGEETRAPKQMCRRPPSNRYVRV
jgi:hypothetical protein